MSGFYIFQGTGSSLILLCGRFICTYISGTEIIFYSCGSLGVSSEAQAFRYFCSTKPVKATCSRPFSWFFSKMVFLSSCLKIIVHLSLNMIILRFMHVAGCINRLLHCVNILQFVDCPVDGH